MGRGEGSDSQGLSMPTARRLAQMCPESQGDSQAADRHGWAYLPIVPAVGTHWALG